VAGAGQGERAIFAGAGVAWQWQWQGRAEAQGAPGANRAAAGGSLLASTEAKRPRVCPPSPLTK
jgi:hypothetical protein